jgi:prepilin-type N-terminal cleavage/methylation domain-containing protein
MPRVRTRIRRGGFSFTEIVIVLAILAIIGTTGISYILGSVPHAKLESGELALGAALNTARYMALSEETPVRLVIDEDTGTWQTEKLVEGAWAFEDSDALPDGCSFGPGGTTFPGGTVEFTPRGALLAGGMISIANAEGENRYLTGNLATGRFAITEGHLR